MMAKVKIKAPSGGARLVEAGRSPMLLGWEPADKQLIREAAARAGQPMTAFVQAAALVAARKLLGFSS